MSVAMHSCVLHHNLCNDAQNIFLTQVCVVYKYQGNDL